MTGDEAWKRADWARWFLDRDEPDEAALVLEPGDELVLGRSDYLNLAAALARRGFSATYELQRVSVVGSASPRKPPLRATPASPSEAKKTA
jgi:hypothetical protein